MKAFVINKYKGPLEKADVPEPVVGERDVLVRVQAAGLRTDFTAVASALPSLAV